ncbi:MAG: ribose 5-phosphate isomerase B [Candidatus Parcubacteria bacterium]|nr:ribose 5-phosphate isomerase B [Candidatus Parcubacteria bacterium]
MGIIENEHEIAIACDHAGFWFKDDLKRFLVMHGYRPIDCGCNTEESVDYPDYAIHAINQVMVGKASRAILVCGTGIGMSIMANRFPGIRAVVAYNEEVAKLSREHNDSNVLCLGAKQFNSVQLLHLVDKWLTTEFSRNERHVRRLQKIEEYAKEKLIRD